MADFNELANTPVDMELGGKKYKIRRVSLDTIFGKAEAAVIGIQMKRISDISSSLTGEDKTSYLAKATLDSIPTGSRLNEMAASFLRSVDGVKMVLLDALRKDQPDIENHLDVAKLVQENADQVAMAVKFAVEGRSGTKPNSPLSETVTK